MIKHYNLTKNITPWESIGPHPSLYVQGDRKIKQAPADEGS